MLFCKNCKKSCSDVEGNFGCLGLPNKTTVDDILARVNALLCENCQPPQISVDSECFTNTSSQTSNNLLHVTLLDKGKAEKVTLELYQGDVLFRTLRVTSTGIYEFDVPFDNYRIRAYNTYDFDCSTAFINYRHQCVGRECIKPLLTINPRYNPPSLNVNVLSMGETTAIELKIYRENTLLQSKTITNLTSFDIPVASGTYTVSYVAACSSGESVSEDFKVVFPDNSCDISVNNFRYDCSSNGFSLDVTGGSLAYQYSLDQTNWFDTLTLLNISATKFYTLYIRDKNNTSCVLFYPFNTLCECQLSFEVSEIQCNKVDCQLSFTYSEVQCSNTLICNVNGKIEILN